VGLPALLRAYKLQKRAARVGFDWDEPEDVVEKINEELDELSDEMSITPYAEQLERYTDEVGDLMFSCVNLSRKLGIDPEAALRHTNGKFERRFRHMEKALEEQGRSVDGASPDELEKLWEEAKKEEKLSV
jgi:MazG family protein